MRKPLLLIVLLLSPTLFAATADLQIYVANLSTTPTLTGERMALSLRWRNNGPDTAHTLHLRVTGTPVPFYILSVATSGWPCYPSPDGTSFLCQNVMLAPGADADLVLQILTPPTPGTFTLRAELSADETDPKPADNAVQFTMELEAAPSADLSITPSTQAHRANAGAPVTMPILVTNHSSIEVRNLLAYVSVPIDALLPFEVSGAGWSCGHLAYGAQAVICTRPRLAAGEVAPLTLTANAPPYDFTFYARVRGEQHSDPMTANDSATATIEVGPRVPEEEEGWSRILVPLGGPDVRGSNNSLWRVENTGVILSDEPIEILPQFCTLIDCLQPLRTVFDLKNYAIAGENNNGSIIYVRESEASKLRLNSRVYDVSRSDETAGAEIPIVREEELTLSSMSIVGIPVAPHYRHTLRVYDVDAREGAEVEVRLFANGETTPRSSTVHTLAVPPYASPLPPEHPTIPGYLQLELGQLLPLAGISTLRVDVEPVAGGSHLWSFVSVTNNDTHHVTTFSAQ